MYADTTRDLVLPLGSLDQLDEAVSLVGRAEELGYGYVTSGETTGHNVLGVLSVLADRTDDIGITNNVFSPFSRSPALLGQTAVTMQAISGGRYRLRIGASSPALAERWHGVEFDRPVRRLRETIEIVRQVQSGQRIDYDGEVYDPGGLQLGCPPPAEPAPVDVAALGPKSTEMAGRFADGWVPQLLPIDGLRDRLADLRHGAALADRDPCEIRVTPTVRCCAIEDGDQAREYAREHVAFMIARYGPYYRRAIADAGWADITDTVRSRWQDGDRDGAITAVTDALLDDLVAAGTPAEARSQLDRFAAVDGVDSIQVSLFGQMDEAEREQTVEAVGP